MSNINIGSIGQSSILEIDSSHNFRDSSPSQNSIDEPNALFEAVCEVFMKAKEERQESDIQAITNALKTLKFFQDLQREDVDFDDFLQSIYEVLNHEHFHKNQPVFHFGDRGTKFYVIIKGRVDVYVPKSREEIEKTFNEKKEKNENIWRRRSIRYRQSIFQEALEKEKERNANITPSNRQSFAETSSPRHRKDTLSSQFSGEISKPQMTKRQSRQRARENVKELEIFVNINEKGMYIEDGVLRFKKVRTLNVGDTFGELALSSDMARSATVIASKDLQMLSLSKAAYKKIFEYLERNLKQKWRFFSEITENSSQELILGFCYGFKEKTFKYGQTLFHQGQTPKDIFIVRDGEIQIVKYEQQGNNNTDNLKHLRKQKKTLVEKRIVNLGPYNLVGEGAALLSQKYDYTARSVSNDTVAYVLPIAEFEKLRLKYAEIWERVLKKHETKNAFWERRASNISYIQDKIEEDRLTRIRSNSNNKSNMTARDDSFDSVTMNNDEDQKDSLLSRRKNGYKLPLKIFPNQRVESLPNNSNNGQKVSPYSSEKLSSFGYEDASASEMEFTQRDMPEPVSARKKEIMNASFSGAKAIPGIVESKFKVMQKISLQEKDGQAVEGQDVKSYALSLSKNPSSSTPQKLFEAKAPVTERRGVKKDSFLGSQQGQSQSHYMPYHLEMVKGKIKEKSNMNSLQLERLSRQELETVTYGQVKSTTINSTSRSTLSMKKTLKLGDSPPLKDFGSSSEYQFSTEEGGARTERLKVNTYLPKIEMISGGGMQSARGYKSARAFQTTNKSQYMKNSDYFISETSEDLLAIELGTPFKPGQQSASLCINTFKTADQVPQLSNIFKRVGDVVSPVQNLKELKKVPTSFLRKASMGKMKNKTIFPSHHNMFRMKPDKLHLLANSYKFDLMSPSEIRAKR